MKLFILLVHYMMHLESGIVYNIAFKLKDMLEKKIQEDLFEAMKSHDETRVSALRAVKTAIQNEKTNGKFHELTEADIVKIVQKQIKQREEAENIYREAGREELANKEQDFSYRHSAFMNNNLIIIQSKLMLDIQENQDEIKQKMDENLNSRKSKQPINMPNAGSTFKRGSDFITAKLIDECGLKGYTIGGAQISDVHAGFVVNTGNATAEDVLSLVDYVKNKVYEKFKKEIQLEVEVIGE